VRSQGFIKYTYVWLLVKSDTQYESHAKAVLFAKERVFFNSYKSAMQVLGY